MTDEELRIVKDKINSLKNLFVYQNNILHYSKRTQRKANKYLREACEILGVFGRTAKTEEKNLDKEIFYNEERLSRKGKPISEKVLFVDPNGMKQRVGEVLDTDDLHSCLKSMAVSNKCAHVIGSELLSRSNIINEYYSRYNPNYVKGKISFKRNFSEVFPDINPCDLYHMDTTQGYKKIRSSIKKVKEDIDSLSIDDKKDILIFLNISVSNKSDEEINELLLNVDMQKLDYSYIYRAYQEGQELSVLEDRMFSIKDKFIIMIGQELKKDLKHVKYKIQETLDGENGFKHMLTIDIKELSYPIEVHIPNFLYHAFVDVIKLKDSGVKTGIHVMDKAIYERKPEEAAKIAKALKEGKIPEAGTPLETEERARLISRGYVEGPNGYFEFDPLSGDGGGSVPPTEVDLDKDYHFITLDINPDNNLFEDFLISIGGFETFIEESREVLHNENNPIEVNYGSLCDTYFNLFKSFDMEYKKDFISYSYEKLMNGDMFDKSIYSNKILNEYYNDEFINSFGRFFICKDLYKNLYYNNYKKMDVDRFIKNVIIMEIDNDLKKEREYDNENGFTK
ncbi:MAG: hypothetical protein IKR57_05815 [Bacilli bacterium]|nr:hypothetical protein [Bacilli bacterium]